MDDEPRALLTQIIDTFSLDIINDKKRLENLLNDYFQGNFRKEKNTIIASLEEGIPGDLIKTHSSIPIDTLVSQMARRLTDNRGISQDLAVWGVSAWGSALKIIQEIENSSLERDNQTVSLTILSTPSHAKVFVNSQNIGTTPITVSSIPAGSNLIQCVADGYEEWKKAYDFDSKNQAYSITATLSPIAPKKGWIFTASNPPGAWIYLNKGLKGNTPLSIPDLEPGTYLMTFTLDNFQTWEKEVTVEPGQLLNIHANLVKSQISGIVEITSSPPGAACYIDDQYKSIVPNVFQDISPGKHNIRCTFAGYPDETYVVEVKPGERNKLKFRFSHSLPIGGCDYCGRVDHLPFSCTFCGGRFCVEHRLPENHECPGILTRTDTKQPGKSRPAPSSSGAHSAPRPSSRQKSQSGVPMSPPLTDMQKQIGAVIVLFLFIFVIWFFVVR